MRTYTIRARDWNIDINERLHYYAKDAFFTLNTTAASCVVHIATQAELIALCDAVSKILVIDCARDGISELSLGLPLLDDERDEICDMAYGYINLTDTAKRVSEDLQRLCKRDNVNTLVLDSYFRFRMRGIKHEWEQAIDRAAGEILLREEQMELLSILGAFIDIVPSEVDCATVMINADGSCQISDDKNTHVDYPPGAFDSALALLLAIAPHSVVVYDLSNGAYDEIILTLLHIFDGKVRVFRAIRKE